MKRKITPESYTNHPAAGVGILSGFGTPDHPPEYGLNDQKVPKSDTHPGPGLKRLNGKAGEPRAEMMLGEDD